MQTTLKLASTPHGTVVGISFLIFSSLLTALVVFIAFIRKSARRLMSQCLPAMTASSNDLSIERDQPMSHLLRDDDLQFLRTQPKFTTPLATKFRIQRSRIVRAYLREIDADFKQICLALKVVMVQSKHDRPDLASALIRHQFAFAYRKMVVQFQVVLYRYGVRTVDVTHLVKLFDGMRQELRSVLPAQAAVRP